MKKIIMLIVLSLFILGCGEPEPASKEVAPPAAAEPVETVPELVPEPAPEPVSESESEPVPTDSLIISGEERDKAAEKLVSGIRVAISTESFPTGLTNGESATVVVAGRNMDPQTEEFTFELSFRDAKDSYSNTLNVDEDFILNWFDTSALKPITLGQLSEVYYPLQFTIGDVSEGVAPKKGTYTFTIQLNREKKRYAREDISIRVK